MSDLDLNLLRVFDTLIELRSVTRAAERLGLTQPAVSHALRRLRSALDDPLFLRCAGGLQPTKRAEQIAPGIRDGLRQLRGAFVAPVSDPAQATRRFTIAADAYFCNLLIPKVIERLRREAPGLTVHLVPITRTLVPSLDYGAIDLALAGDVSLPKRFVEKVLFVEKMVLVAAADNPLSQQAALDPTAIERAPRVVLVKGGSMDESPAQAIETLQKHCFPINPTGALPHASVEDMHIVYDFQTAVEVAACTNMIALVPQRLAVRAKKYVAIKILDSGDITNSFDVSMFWHSKHKSDSGLAWLREIVAQAAH